MKKPFSLLAGAVVLTVLMAAGCSKGGQAQAPQPLAEQPAGTQASTVVSETTPKTPLTPKTVSGSVTQVAKTVTVSFTGTAFSPASVTVNVGDKIKVVNNSDDMVQPASDPHPIHTGNTALNAKGPLAKGESFTTGALTKAGTFGMHNHLNPSQHLTVVVK